MDRLLLKLRSMTVVVAVTIFFALAIAAPQGLAADDFLNWDEAMLFGGGEPVLVEQAPEEASPDPAQDLLVRDVVEIGGTYRFSLESSWLWGPGKTVLNFADADHETDYQLGGTLFLDTRPSTDFRIFSKAKLNGGKNVDPSVQLTELFADLSVKDTVFLRTGKQTIRWGIGYFFSPADIINIGRIDPQDPLAEREGPIALRAHIPRGSNNYYMHVIVDPATSPATLAWAPKAEWVLGKTEWGLGGYYRHDRAPRGMVTFSSSLGQVSLFGEGVVSYGSDKRFVQENAGAPLGVEVVRRDTDYFAHGTLGARYAYHDPEGRFNVSGAGQYYYNGEGYAKGFLAQHQMALGALMFAGDLSPFDLQSAGRHYAAVSLNWSKALGSRLSPGLFWLGNIQDGSGMVTTSVGLDLWPKINTSLGLTHMYGDPGSEYAPVGSLHSLFVRVGFSGSF